MGRKKSRVANTGNYKKHLNTKIAVKNESEILMCNDYTYSTVLHIIKNLALIIDAKNNGSFASIDTYNDIIKILNYCCSQEQKQAIYYRYCLDMTETDTSKKMQCSITKVETLIKEAFRNIEAHFSSEGE